MTKSISILILLLLACQSGSKLDEPPTIRYGEDPCDECYMLINEERHANAYTSKQGQARRFDDIGCMLIYHNKHHEVVASYWVKDFNTQEWLRADEAIFLKSDSIHTPMGFGIVAFRKEQIEKEILESYPGEIIEFTRLLETTDEMIY